MKIQRQECKYLLRELARKCVAPEILNLPKTGFSIPVENYLRGPWQADFTDRVLRDNNSVASFIDARKMKDVWQKFLHGSNASIALIWAIYIFSLWVSEFHQRQTFGVDESL